MNDSEHVDHRIVVAAVLAGLVAVPLNSTMIVVALPRMATDLHQATSTMSWLVTIYLIGMASLQPGAGRLSDRFGRRPVLLGGYACFGAFSAVAIFASSLPMLIGCRLGQALAGALIVPAGTALIRDTVPSDRLGRAIGGLGAAMPLAAAAGPVLGGALIRWGGWPAVFLINVPLLGSAFILGLYAIPRSQPAERSKFDLVGVMLLSAVLIGTTLLLAQPPELPLLIGCCFILILAAGALVRHESRHPAPILPLPFFTRPGLMAAMGGVALANFAFYVTLLAIPLLLYRRGFEESRIGLVLASMTLASAPLSAFGGRLVDRIGARWPAVAGLAFVTCGLIPLAVDPTRVTSLRLVAVLAVIGAGVGMSMPAFQIGAVQRVEPSRTGLVFGVFSTSRYLGSIVGTGLLAGPLAPAETGMDGFDLLFSVLAAVALTGVAIAVMMPGGTAPEATRS